MRRIRLCVLALLTASGLNVQAQEVEVKDVETVKTLPPVKGVDAPPTGRKAADTYMRRTGKANGSARGVASSGSRDHYMAVHLGHAVDSTAYEWGNDSENDDVSRISAGVTYRIGEWVNSMDLLFRGEFQSFTIGQEKPLKLSLMPMIVFPDSNSQFPLYFGGGAGIGVFFKQLDDESALSFELQLLAGLRFFELLDSVGFFIETGLKNHLSLLSDGQLNSVHFSVGSIFTF